MSRIGVRRKPAVVRMLADDLAVEISRDLQRRGLKGRQAAGKLSLSPRRCGDLNAYLAGVDTGEKFGLVPALRAAEDLEIPVLALIGEEARRAAEFLGIPLPTRADRIAA